jgi:hypothetical protein
MLEKIGRDRQMMNGGENLGALGLEREESIEARTALRARELRRTTFGAHCHRRRCHLTRICRQ